MNVAIVGIGGVGGYVGSKLILSKDDKDKIIFISRGKQLKKIEKEGLKLIDEDNEYLIKPDIVTDNPKELGTTFDVVIVAVKSYDLKEALLNLSSNISDKTIILPLLNGVDHDKEIKKLYPNSKVINGCIYILSNLKDIATVKKYGGVLNLIFGSNEIDIDELKPLKELFDKAGIKNRLTKDIELEVWKKYMLISAYASMTSYYKKSLGFIAQNKIDELESVLNEVKNVANKKRVKIEQNIIDKILTRIKTLPYESKTSMQLDFEKGKKTELEALCGYVVKEGERLGVKTPLMKKYYEALKNR